MAKHKKHKTTTLRRELAEVINRHGREAASNTPDFILACYVIGCLDTYEQAIAAREEQLRRVVPQLPFSPVRDGASYNDAEHGRIINISTPGGSDTGVRHAGVMYPSDPRGVYAVDEEPQEDGRES